MYSCPVLCSCRWHHSRRDDDGCRSSDLGGKEELLFTRRLNTGRKKNPACVQSNEWSSAYKIQFTNAFKFQWFKGNTTCSNVRTAFKKEQQQWSKSCGVPWSHNRPPQPSWQWHCHGSWQVPCLQAGYFLHSSQKVPCQPSLHLWEDKAVFD